MWCDACRSTGAIHCAHPDQCGNMLSATAAADNWKAWLDDLPLPSDFDPAVGRLQDFITGLAAASGDTLAAESASLKAREKVDANLLLAAYKGLLVLHRMLSKSGLSVGAETATYITDQIAAAHPEMPGLASLRAAPTDPGDGWTWNERLGWIGPDGKPADPRRRG